MTPHDSSGRPSHDHCTQGRPQPHARDRRTGLRRSTSTASVRRRHKDLITAARAFQGCLDIAVTPDPVDPARVHLFELWESDERLQEWRAMAPVPADVPHIVRDEVQLHRISASGSPF
ncbi:putative quinol monooxygenase [Pseudonocardia kongjuensis]|uniref:putative quinol monooxygenase n=1 Tax=Pseudonocardia kongjuensis TaxID=102227 RepID=UPI003CD06832